MTGFTLLYALIALFVVVFIVMPLACLCIGGFLRKDGGSLLERTKGLYLPEGSIRAMLALAIVGAFIIVMVLGPMVDGLKESFDKILAAFSALTGAVTGFYFGNRGGASK